MTSSDENGGVRIGNIKLPLTNKKLCFIFFVEGGWP
jgi:hypothetical protein